MPRVWGGGSASSVNLISDQIQLDSASNNSYAAAAVLQQESPDFTLIHGNSLLAVAPPMTVTPQVLGAILGETEATRREIIEYEVKSGDTFSGIAENFGISLNTILWANNLSKGSTLKAGQKLVIAPVSGVIYHVKSGDTVSEIADKYKAKADEIVAFNELSSEGDIFIGDILVIPDGTMPATVSALSYVQVPVASSYFICPIAAPCRITQRLHWYNAVDFSHGKCGDSIYAAAGGTVTSIKYGWNGGGGNTITILHPNGVATSYGHVQAVLVSPGDQVYQGQIIALVGGQPGTPGSGLSTGCHVHFAVHGGNNPFSK
ncbi:MAG: M23 family metallopeptidase [Patescibacteria group bacterium]